MFDDVACLGQHLHHGSRRGAIEAVHQNAPDAGMVGHDPADDAASGILSLRINEHLSAEIVIEADIVPILARELGDAVGCGLNAGGGRVSAAEQREPGRIIFEHQYPPRLYLGHRHFPSAAVAAASVVYFSPMQTPAVIRPSLVADLQVAQPEKARQWKCLVPVSSADQWVLSAQISIAQPLRATWGAAL